MPKQRIRGQNVVKWPEVGAKTRASPKCRDVQELASKTARQTLRNPGTIQPQGFCRESGYSCLLVEETIRHNYLFTFFGGANWGPKAVDPSVVSRVLRLTSDPASG